MFCLSVKKRNEDCERMSHAFVHSQNGVYRRPSYTHTRVVLRTCSRPESRLLHSGLQGERLQKLHELSECVQWPHVLFGSLFPGVSERMQGKLELFNSAVRVCAGIACTRCMHKLGRFQLVGHSAYHRFSQAV